MVNESTPRAAVAGLAGLAAAHATIQFGVLGLSAIGWRIGPGTSAVILLAAASAAVFMARWCLPPAGPADSPRSRGAWVASPLLLAAATVWAILLNLAARRSVYDWDGLYYHLPAIDAWVKASRVHWIETIPDVPFVNGYPMAVETLDFLVVQLTGSSRWLDAGNLAFWPLGAFGLVVAAARCGARGGWAWSAAAGLAGVPMLVAQSATAYVDAAHACCVMAAFGAAAWLLDRPQVRRSVLLGLCLGLTIATKGTGVLVAAVLGGTSFFLLWRMVTSRRSLAQIVASVTIVALAVCGWWFARNLLHTGNPFHPVRVELLGHVLFEGVDARAHTLLNLPSWLEPWPPALRPLVSWTQPDAPIVGYGAISGLGTLWLLGGLPACIVVVLIAARTRRAMPTAAAVLLFTGVAVLIAQPAPWWGRFTLWLHALGLPLLAASMQRLWDTGWRGRWVAAIWAVVLVGSASYEAMHVVRGVSADGRMADRSYAESIEYVFPQLTDVAPEAWSAPRLARSPFGRWGTLLGGALVQPAGERRIEVLGADPRPETLLREGYRWVLWDVVGAGDPPAALLRAARERHDYAPSPERHFVLLSLGEAAGPSAR